MGYTVYSKYGTKIHIYKFNPSVERFAVEIGVKGKLERLHQIPQPKSDEITAAAININFFDWTGKNNDGYGEIEQDGVQLKPESWGFPSISFKDGKLVFGDLKNAQVGVGIGVTLIIDGKINIINRSKLPTGRDAKTAVAQDKDGNILFVVVEGDDVKNKGITTNELANFLLSLNCVNAFQGDSGGSSSMYYNGKYVYDQGRSIAAALVAYKKKEKPIKTMTVKVNTSLNIRQSPTLLSKVVGSYKNNAKVDIYEEKDGWCRTDKGWVSKQYLV